MKMPPPRWAALLLVTVPPSKVSIPWLVMPPPLVAHPPVILPLLSPLLSLMVIVPPVSTRMTLPWSSALVIDRDRVLPLRSSVTMFCPSIFRALPSWMSAVIFTSPPFSTAVRNAFHRDFQLQIRLNQDQQATSFQKIVVNLWLDGGLFLNLRTHYIFD